MNTTSGRHSLINAEVSRAPCPMRPKLRAAVHTSERPPGGRRPEEAFASFKDLFEQFISHAIPDVVVNIITLVGVTAVLFTLNWKLTLLSTIPIPLVILSLRVYARYVRPAFRHRQEFQVLGQFVDGELVFDPREVSLHPLQPKVDLRV